MTDVRTQIWRRILGSPWVVLPVAVAAGALIAGLPWLAAGAGIFTLGSISVRIATGFDRWKTEAESTQEASVQAESEARLDDLAKRLRSDRDYRTKDALAMARSAMLRFRSRSPESELRFRTLEIGNQMSRLFQATIDHLHTSLRLFEEADRIAGSEREQRLAQREQMVVDALAAAQKLHAAADRMDDLLRENRDADIQPLQDELERSIEVAKRTEERMREFDSKIIDPIHPQSE